MRFIGRAAADYKIHGFEALSLNLSVGLDMTVTDSYNGVSPGSFQAYTDTANLGVGRYNTGYNLTRSQMLEAYLAFNDSWGIHKLDAVAGYSWQNNYQANRSINYFNVKINRIVKRFICIAPLINNLCTDRWRMLPIVLSPFPQTSHPLSSSSTASMHDTLNLCAGQPNHTA